MTASQSGLPSIATRALGAVGILGGLGLLLAFVVEIPSGWNTVRILMFPAGALAVAVAAYATHAAASRATALAGTIPVALASGTLIAWELLALGRDLPFAGDFGLIGFWVGLAFWLTGAWFGLIALRLGVLWQLAAVALVKLGTATDTRPRTAPPAA